MEETKAKPVPLQQLVQLFVSAQAAVLAEDKHNELAYASPVDMRRWIEDHHPEAMADRTLGEGIEHAVEFLEGIEHLRYSRLPPSGIGLLLGALDTEQDRWQPQAREAAQKLAQLVALLDRLVVQEEPGPVAKEED